MQLMYPEIQPDAAPVAHRPTALELGAAGLLLATVILHVVAMLPQYFGGAGQGSLTSQPDQAALYAVLAAGWAGALGIALTGPARSAVAAGLAAGLAVTEFGFRLSDLGQVFRYGSGQGSTGLWLMTAAWAVGAAGAGVAVVAARRRTAPASALSDAAAGAGATEPAAAELAPTTEAPASDLWARPQLGSGAALSRAPEPWAPPAAVPAVPAEPAEPAHPAEPAMAAAPDVPAPDVPAPEVVDPASEPSAPAPGTGEQRPARHGAGPTLLVAALAVITAGAFLPAWDHYVGISTTTGRSITFNLGNAFQGPWQVVLGTVCAALALAAVPIVAIRLRARAVGAAAVAGSLIVLAGQFAAAVVQVDQVVPASVAGLSPSQANQLGLQLHLELTGWFTFDLIAAFCLFVAAMVLGHAREIDPQAISAATRPIAPDARRAATLPWS